MHTSLLLIALAGPAAAPTPQSPHAPVWQDSYGVARKVGQEKGKPLAVFVGSGPAGWEKLTNDGKPTSTIQQLLADRFVCIYVDATTPEGRRLAAAFEVPGGTGLVVSTRDGEGQAFSHQGTMSCGELEETLRKYGADRAIRQTESLERVRTSYYSSPAASPAPGQMYTPANYAAPMYAPMNQGGFGGFRGGFSGGGRGC